MEFRCEDLPEHGVVLIPPTAPQYDELLGDIRHRLDNPVAGSPPPLGKRTGAAQISDEDRWSSAILLNHSKAGIAAIQQVWSYRESGGRTKSIPIGGIAGSSMLLPFDLPEPSLKLYGYWHVILPGSKRYLNSSGEILGDNSDVRPPSGQEMWTGGAFSVRGRAEVFFRNMLEEVRLTLDGVFFTDGGFAGPNRYSLWDQVVSRAATQLQVAQIARRGHNDGLHTDQIFKEIEHVTGPPQDRPPVPPPPSGGWTSDSHRRHQIESVAFMIARIRQSSGDERTIFQLMDWANAPVPPFHRL